MTSAVHHFPDSIRLAEDPAAIVARLVETCEEFVHIQEAAPRMPVLFSERALYLHGGQKAAIIVEPRWQGPLAHATEFLYAQLLAPVLDWEDPDFVIVVDRAVWDALDLERRERLMFHELCHVVWVEDEFGVRRRNRETGRPIIKLGPHDAEIFHSEVEKYGPEIVGIETLCQAIATGFREAERRKKRIA